MSFGPSEKQSTINYFDTTLQRVRLYCNSMESNTVLVVPRLRSAPRVCTSVLSSFFMVKLPGIDSTGIIISVGTLV